MSNDALTGGDKNTRAAPCDPAADGWKQAGRTGYIKLIGPVWTRRAGASWEYGIQVDERHLNPVGVVHGGVLMSLVDSAISLVAWEAADRQTCLTVQLDTHFMQGVRAGAFVVGRGEVMRKTSSMVFLRGTLTVEDEVVMSALAVMKIIKPREGKPAGESPSP